MPHCQAAGVGEDRAGLCGRHRYDLGASVGGCGLQEIRDILNKVTHSVAHAQCTLQVIC